jgi:APA family basic amino acid/polyamine antiporter
MARQFSDFCAHSHGEKMDTARGQKMDAANSPCLRSQVSKVEAAAGEKLSRRLGGLDATALLVGSMIGSGIFIAPSLMARNIAAPGIYLGLWILAGLFTLLGAFSYAELAAMMPQAGGQYVYLRRAFGPLPGFLYGWTLFLVIQSGFIAAVAIAFA